MLLCTLKMPLAASATAAALALVTVTSLPARAEPALPYDRCDYMHHDSKAYKACIADAAQAKLRTEAAPVAPAAPPKTKPEMQPRS
jgi:hypothetical protein